jgi:CheY-like chemotaxis protein
MSIARAARVLIVDDEPMVAHNLQVFLEDEGMVVTAVDSAEAALALVRKGVEYDVCIMDLRLPGMDGNRGIQALHALRPALKFVVHTGSVNYTLSAEVRALGISPAQLFSKPMPDMRPLARMVRELASS